MKTVAALLLLPLTAAAQTPGRLFVHMNGGYEVVVDNTSVGMTSDEVGGKVVNLGAGKHHVVIRSSDGREGAFDVTIAPGQVSDVNLSPLGLRKKISVDGEPGALHLVCVPEDCSVTFRDKDKIGNDDTIDAVPGGRYPLLAVRGATTLRANIDIPPATIVTVEANFTTRLVRITDTRPRPRHLDVAEANDALTGLNVPSYWKSAIRSVLPAGVSVTQAHEVDNNGIRASLRVPSSDVGYSLISSMSRSRAFSQIEIPEAPRKEQSAWLVDFTFYFPER